MKYKLIKMQKKAGVPVTFSSDLEGELIQLDPDKGLKYALSVDVGNLPPQEAMNYLSKYKDSLADFFGAGSFILIPVREGRPSLEIFELQPDFDD